MSKHAANHSAENNDVVYLTKEGYQRLQERLEYLIKVRRPQVAEQIREAKAMGDISENAGYDEAKNAQAFLEGEIAELEWKLKHAVIIDENGTDGRVQLGSKVTVVDEESGLEETYTIVGSAEADPFDGRISNESPVGKALMGHQEGDVVEVQTPAGTFRMRIVSVR